MQGVLRLIRGQEVGEVGGGKVIKGLESEDKEDGQPENSSW